MDADAVQLPAPVVRLTNHEARAALEATGWSFLAFTFPRLRRRDAGLCESGASPRIGGTTAAGT